MFIREMLHRGNNSEVKQVEISIMITGYIFATDVWIEIFEY
jgi:hypothetical protein